LLFVIGTLLFATMYNSNYIESINNTLSLLERHAAKIIKEDEAFNKKINYAEYKDAVNKAKLLGLITINNNAPKLKYIKVTNHVLQTCYELYMQGLSRKQIAHRVNLPETTVASRLSLYKKRMKNAAAQ